MLTINLQPQDEYQWRDETRNPSPATFPKEKGWYPLYHQWRTYNAEQPIIVNTYNTGTGKTKAAFLRLLKRAQVIGFEHLYPSQHNALLIAPTNELLSQHVKDAKEFCQDNKLPYRVLAITKADLDTYQVGKERGGYTLHKTLNNPSEVDGDTSKRATLCVVNPDIFYYAVLLGYCQFDRGALFTDFFSLFNYIIVDEFHYYDPKQLATFLFFMQYSQHLGYIKSDAKKRQFCILTATPNEQVEHYLEDLGLPIAWIRPGEIDDADRPYVKPVRALAPVQLQVYHTEELRQEETQGRLLHLLEQQLSHLRAWLADEQDGAIISSSLGMVNQIHAMLKYNGISTDVMGRITGAEDRAGRSASKEKQLILATPTVDIGYNFDREKKKLRQNIDFLFYDAFSGDEFIQRLGRAGRVLAVEEKDHHSVVLAMVDPDVYKLLEAFDGKDLERAALGELAKHMPKRNDLYAYVSSGAILEILRAIVMIGQGLADSDLPKLEAFFQRVQELFGVKKPFLYTEKKWKIWDFEARKKRYAQLKTIPVAAFEEYQLRIGKPVTTPLPTEMEKSLAAFHERIKDAKEKHGSQWKSSQNMRNWLQRDVRNYFVDQARFTFRDSFQPPLALIYDKEGLHSSNVVARYDALHIARYYEAPFYASAEEWEQETGQSASREQKNVLAYCRLLKLRSAPLQLGLKLDAREYTQNEWEEEFAYRVTALHGLEVVALKDHHGLDATLQSLVRAQFIPAFVALNNAQSATAGEIWRLRKRARFFPMELSITFLDKERIYLIVLGTMAFQVCAEIPRSCIAIDRRKTLLDDDSLYIC